MSVLVRGDADAETASEVQERKDKGQTEQHWQREPQTML